MVSVGSELPGVLAIGQRATGIFAVGQEARGFIAIGQLATGVIAIGQLALGVVAIGQLARGVIAAGQLAVGLAAAGQVAAGVVWCPGLGVGGFSGSPVAFGFFRAAEKTAADRLAPPEVVGPAAPVAGLAAGRGGGRFRGPGGGVVVPGRPAAAGRPVVTALW